VLTRLGRAARRRLAEERPWTDVYGLARTLIASATALTLIFSHSSSLFRPGVGLDQAPVCTGGRAASLFCLVPSTHLEIARWVAVAILVVVASGWRPRITGVLHWWVSLSLFCSAVMVDGGDQCAAVLSLLLLPVTLTDPRRWHWEQMPATYDEKAALVARSALALVRLQVAGIYFHAAIGKIPVEEWSDGTALYYWLLDPTLGAANWLSPLLRWLLLNSAFVAFLTWSVLALETLLFMGLVAPKSWRKWLLVGGLTLHAGIIVIHGLWSFGLTMFGALVLFLRPFEEDFGLSRVLEDAGARLRHLRASYGNARGNGRRSRSSVVGEAVKSA
jgi:antimicrobial peptide system SdpB family protein